MLEAEAEAEAKILASRRLWPRGLNITGVPATTGCADGRDE